MKKNIILIIGILVIAFISEYKNNDIIGNTDEEILQYVNEDDFADSYENDNAGIIDTVYIDNSKIVTFLSETRQGYVVYEKNKKGNYILTDYSSNGIDEDELGVTNDIVRYNQNKGLDNSKLAYLVISDGSKVSTVEMLINDHEFKETMEIGKPSMVLLSDVLSEDELNEMISFDCRYFDVDNKELKVEN